MGSQVSFVLSQCTCLTDRRTENLSNSAKKTQNKGYYSVQGHRGRYQSKARVRLPISD